MNRTDIFFQTKFLKSAFSIQDLPDDIGSEVSFCGRSNSGESSVLNALTGNKKLAKISKTPGRTQSMNIFSLDPSLQKRIVDLPGYGFARVSKSMRRDWGQVIGQYLKIRKSLKGIVVIMDIRHPFMDSDLNLISWSNENNIPLKILFNKADKFPKNKTIEQVVKGNHVLKKLKVFGEIQVFSSKNLTGLDEFKESLSSWF